MVQKDKLQSFTQSWNQTAAWAQAQGIPRKDYYPIYQMDSTRLLTPGSNPMSQAERTRAILAAHNPNQVTPVPGDKPNPTNIVGNAVTDLRNIFTGLAPNHLIPNIFDTVKNTILHPATVIKPLGEIIGGVASGNVNEVKTGFEQAAGLQGPGSILSWLPGVYDAGLYAQGGLSEVLSHPVTSLLDVAPWAPAGRIIDAAANASRVASIAEKLGMTSEQLRDASLPGMAKSWMLSRELGQTPFLKSHVPALTDLRSQPITIGSALDRWITTHTGMGKTLSALMKGMLNINHHETQYELAMMRPAQLALGALKTDEERAQVDGLLRRTDPRTKGKTTSEIENDQSIPQNIRTAYGALENVRQWVSDTALASGAVVARMRPDGSVGFYHTYGEPSEVLKAGQTLQDAQDTLIKTMEPAHRLTKEMASWDVQAASLGTQFGQSIAPAEQAARKLQGQERVVIDRKEGKLGAKAKVKTVSLDIQDQVRELFGSEEGVGGMSPYTEAKPRGPAPKTEAGIMGRVQIALDQRDYTGLREYTGLAKRRLDLANYKLREGQADDPALIRLGGQIDALHSYAAKRMEYEQKFRSIIEGEMEKGASKLAGTKTVKKKTAAGSTIDPAVQRRYDKAKAAFDRDLTNDAARQEFDAASKALMQAPRIRGDQGFRAVRQTKELRAAFKAYLQAQRDYGNAVFAHPTADWIDLVRDKFVEGLIAEEDKFHRFDAMTKVLRDAKTPEARIAEFRADPRKMAQLIELETRYASGSPYGEEIMSEAERSRLEKSALEAADQLRAEGHEVVWIPSVSDTDLRDKNPGRYGIHLASTGVARRSSRGFEKKLAQVAQRHDAVAGIHQAAKEALQIRGTIEYADRILSPHFVYQDEAWQTLKREFPDFDPGVENAPNVAERMLKSNFNMVRFNPQGIFNFTLPKWEKGAIYLPKEIADALPKMLDRGQFPLDGVLDKPTNLFRFAILALSPRYTAHVTFGGTFLLALRSSPQLLAALPDAWRIIHDNGDVPREAIAKGAAQRGVDPLEYQTFNDSPLNVANRSFLHRAASTVARWISQEHIEKVQGVKWTEAGPVHWLKAVGDTNLKFTNAVANFQRAWAYSDFLRGAKKGKLRDPVTGEKLDWTDERVRRMAEHHVAKTLGDLQAMTPLERAWFTKMMPFYGWTKHILEFTGTYPVDHPFRASALTVLANQDTAAVASGLPKRLQFLLFLGSPDIAGNVSAMDVRFMDPLRDVANYATWQGWVSAMNPILTAPLAMIDPQAIYGGVPLYPNVTYDQFYGIETAGAQGNPLTAIEAVVPQVGALDAALGISAQYRQLAQRNPNGFAKAIFQSLNVPFAQVQHLNLKQIAAKNELDRYQVAKQAATNAFDSGDFSAISGLSSVPDPLNSQWDVTPGSLQALYNQLLTEYPGTPPSSTALPPPSAPL